MHDRCKLWSFNGKSDFTFFINHFTAISYFSPLNRWNIFINRLEATLLCSQYSISNSRNGFVTLNIFGGIINHSSLSKGVMKSWMTLLINRCGYPALLYFALIALISMSKFDPTFWDLCKSPEIVFPLYRFGILETQGTVFLISFPYICVVTTPSLFKMIFVSKNFSGFTSRVNFISGWKSFKAANKTSCWNLFLLLYMSSTNHL